MDSIRRTIDALRSALSKRAGLLRVLALVGAALVMTAAVPIPAEACGITDPLSCVAMIFVKIFQLLTALMGWILVLEVEAVIRVSQYFNFVSPGPSAVRLGWIVTRDLANMFFIVILLIIAFGTILGSSTYHYEKNLPRLLIMAVVINFSKTICGLFIDMGQVIMLTFVNGFKEAAAGNFVNAFQINKLLALGNSPGSYTFGMVVAMMFAFILATICVCVTLVLLVVLLFRVVMLWVLIILSPIAFLSSAIPKGGDYYAQWWKEFKKYIITGPIIAFFLWLALASVQDVGPGGFASQGFPATYAGQGEAAAATSGLASGGTSAASGSTDSQIVTEAGTADVIMNLVIAICILFAGLKFASESGAAGAGVAGSIRSGATKALRSAATGGMNASIGAAKSGLKFAAQPLLTGGGRLLAKAPGIGGLGRAAVLKGEQWKNERQAGLEKKFGGNEDYARLSPGAFKRNIDSLASKGNPDAIDKKRLDTMLRTGLADPTIAARMGKDGTGKYAIQQQILSSKGKGLQDAASLMMTDKNLSKWVKDDPDILRSTYEKVKSEALAADGKTVKDPNMLKTLGEMEQKFASQLVREDKNGNSLMDPSRLKNIVPKMSSDDVAGLIPEDMSTFMPHMTSGQLKRLAQDGTDEQQNGRLNADGVLKGGMLNALAGMNDKDRKDVLGKLGTGDIPAGWYGDSNVADNVLERTKGDAKARGEAMAKGGPALSKHADARLAEALKDDNADKVLASLPDAINVGSLSADKILGDSKLQGFISNNPGKIDLASLARNNAPATRDAAQAVAASVIKADPDRAGRMKGEMYQDIRPSPAMMERSTREDSKADKSDRQAAELQKQAAEAQQKAAAAQQKAATAQQKAAQETAGAAKAAAAAAAKTASIESGLEDLGRALEKRNVENKNPKAPEGGSKA